MIKGFLPLREEMICQRAANVTMPEIRPVQPVPAARKSKNMSIAERKQRWPQMPKDVPPHLRKTDMELLQCAKIINPQESYRSAPYAFRYSGHLWAEYKHLRVEAGRHGLTALELSRL